MNKFADARIKHRDEYLAIAETCANEAKHPHNTEEVTQIFIEIGARALRAAHIAKIDLIAADRIFNNIVH